MKSTGKSKAPSKNVLQASPSLPTEIKADNVRVGIFGGTFNPFHVGHAQVIQTVKSRAGLNWISVVPAAQSPFKPETEGPSQEERLEMLRLGIQELGANIGIDTQEIKRGGVSYTIDTLNSYAKEIPPERLFLIIGLDQFESFDRWKSFEQILEIANLIVVTRPELTTPQTVDELPQGLRPLVTEFEKQLIVLSSGRFVEFVRLTDNAVSASQIRKSLRTGRSVERFLTFPVENYIREKGLYAPLGPKIGNFKDFSEFCAQALLDKKAINTRLFDLTGIESISEYVVIASGTSTRHTSALAENVVRTVKEEYNILPQRIEGVGEGRWVLLDYGSLIVHVFYDFVRQEYRLEELWGRGKEIPIVDKTLNK